LGGFGPPAKAGDRPAFVVDPSWPKPLPAPVGTDGVAHPWVQGEVAGTCVDRNNNVYTHNRAWEVGATVNGVLQGNESGAIDGEDATASAIPSPPVVVFNEEGDTIAGWGNPSLYPDTSPMFGFASYMPYGSHGCFVDYQGYIWLGGNGDGVVQKYNPVIAASQGASATFVAQIGVKSECDGPATSDNSFTSCGEVTSTNSSHTLLNEPADIAVDPAPDPVTGTTGSVYIADGYGNHRVVVYTTSDGGKTYQYNRQWGQACTINGVRSDSQACPPGTFGATGGGHPHCVVLGNDGLIYVCDRPNSRIQVFQKNCGAASVNGSQPLCQPVKIYNIGLTPGVIPPAGSVGNNAFDGATSAANAAAIQLAGTRGRRPRLLAQHRPARDLQPHHAVGDDRRRSRQRQHVADRQSVRDGVRSAWRLRHHSVSGTHRRPICFWSHDRGRFAQQRLCRRDDHRPSHPEVRAGQQPESAVNSRRAAARGILGRRLSTHPGS
jgi:hypothetical protein